MNRISNLSLNLIYHHNNENNTPKISFISTVFNKENYLERLIKSVQNQIIKEFELIFIDDFSTDNSVKIIEKFMHYDDRIKLIRNKKNKGTFFSRIKGALKARGEYIIWIDPDDIILKNGLYNSYKHIKKLNLSIVQFNSIIQSNENISLKYQEYIFSDIIKQPFLSYIFYYNETTKKGAQFNTALWDKLINRKVALKAINFIGNDYLKEIVIIENDVLLLFSLFQVADSYQYINDIGYYYIRSNKDSIWNSWKKPEVCGLILHGLFINIKFLYEKAGKTYLGKLFSLFKLQQSFKRYKRCFLNSKNDFIFIYQILELLKNSSFFSFDDKLIIENITLSISTLLNET